LLISTLGAGCKGFQSSSPSSASVQGGGNPFGGPFTMGVLGDSISRGFDILQLDKEDVPDNWATGSKLSDSHLNKFQNLFTQHGWDVQIVPYNLAVVGNTVLGSSSTLAANATQLAGDQPDYVSIEIGANDVCQGLLAPSGAAAAFQSKISSVLSTLLASAHPPKIIAVASIPHIWALTQIPSLASNSGCQAFWNNVCPNLSAGQTAFDAQWTAANQALQGAAAAAGGPVIYDGGVIAGAVFSAGDISNVDCFHPSVQGQSKLSEGIWMATVQNRLPVIMPAQ
jgi:lysophospholipase L1-like esterase